MTDEPNANELSMSASIRAALQQILREHPEAFLIGEDIGVYGGAFKVTRDFAEEFGSGRVIDTPISEAGIVSIAAGAAIYGSRPIVEIMFMDFILLAADGIINVAAKWGQVYGPEFNVPIIIRAPAGGGRAYGPTHSQSFEGLFQNVPGLTICCPSNPADAAAMLIGAYDACTTVLFIEHKALYARKGVVPDTITPILPGVGATARPGSDITLISYGRQIPVTLEAAEQLAENGVSAEVIDLRSVKPLDTERILESMRRTGRGMSIEESPVIGGVGGEISAVIMEHAFDSLEAPFTRLGAAEIAVPCSPELESGVYPTVEGIVSKATELCEY